MEDGQQRWHEQYERGKHRKQMDAECSLRPERDGGYRPLDVPRLGDRRRRASRRSRRARRDQLARHRWSSASSSRSTRCRTRRTRRVGEPGVLAVGEREAGARLTILDQDRTPAIALYDLKQNLVVGDNVIAIDVASHTEKRLNDAERLQFPQSRHHLNRVSGVAILPAGDSAGAAESMELMTDDTWRSAGRRRVKWQEPAYDDAEWSAAAAAGGVTPVDEGPALPPITRKDSPTSRSSWPRLRRADDRRPAGHIRASLRRPIR